MLDWRDLAVFITPFYNVVLLMLDIHKAIATHRDGGQGQDDVTLQGCMGNQIQSDSLFFNTMYSNLHYTMYNNLHYSKMVQNPA